MASISQEGEDGYSCITGTTLQKAIEELNENPATRGSVVKELRDRICAKEKELGVSWGLGALRAVLKMFFSLEYWGKR